VIKKCVIGALDFFIKISKGKVKVKVSSLIICWINIIYVHKVWENPVIFIMAQMGRKVFDIAKSEGKYQMLCTYECEFHSCSREISVQYRLRNYVLVLCNTQLYVPVTDGHHQTSTKDFLRIRYYNFPLLWPDSHSGSMPPIWSFWITLI